MSLCHSALLFSAATHFVPHVIAVFHVVTLIYCEPDFSITVYSVTISVPTDSCPSPFKYEKVLGLNKSSPCKELSRRS